MQRTQSIAWVAAAMALGGCTTMGAQIKSSGAMGNEDTAYISTAYELAQLDDAAGKLAPAQASDPRVLDVSSQLMAQADALSPGLTSALQSQGITPPQQPPAQVASEISQLRSLKGPAFDKAYIADEISLHKQALNVFKKEDADTKNGMMRTEVETEMPAVQDDLNKLQALTVIPNLSPG